MKKLFFSLFIFIAFFTSVSKSINTLMVSYIQSAVNQAINDGLDLCQKEVNLKYPLVYEKVSFQSFSFKILS